MNKKINNQKGMSLVESIMSVGFVSLIIIFGMKQSQMMGKSTFNANIDRDLIDFQTEITQLLSDTGTCLNNFEGDQIGDSYTGINDANDVPLYTADPDGSDSPILNNQVQIKAINTSLEDGQIYVNFELEKLHTNTRSKTINKRILLMAELESDGITISGCFNYQQSTANTVQYLIAKNLCENTYGVGTSAFDLHFDPVARTCSFNGLAAVSTSCPDQIISAITPVPSPPGPPNQYAVVCSNPFSEANPDCPTSWLKSVDTLGNRTCINLADVVDFNTLNFNAGSSCALAVVNNKIKLECSNPPPGLCTDLPISGQCGPDTINGVDYNHCPNPTPCYCLEPGIEKRCVANGAACTALGGCQ